jgi:hypothetical protein
MENIQTAMEKNDVIALDECKNSLGNFIKWAGDAAVNKVLPILDNLATIAPYFLDKIV